MLTWPVDEVLISFLSVQRETHRVAFYHDSQRWAALAPYAKNMKEPTPSRLANVNPSAKRKKKFRAG